MPERRMTNQIDSIATAWVEIVRGEYLEMPCLRLTQAEARRLWGLDDGVCARILTALVDERFLRITGDGRYVRAVVPDRLRHHGAERPPPVDRRQSAGARPESD